MENIITLANGSKLDINNLEITEKVIKKKAVKQPKGFIIYQGNSVLDNAPIVAIATMETANEKTGNMVQVWIIRSDISPVQAVRENKDVSICGNCPHRHNLNGACYVQPFQAPLAVYNGFVKGLYPVFDSNNVNHVKAFEGRSIRLGAYGDPSAVPFEVWENVLQFVVSHTAYTHQIHHKKFDVRIADICMISCDTQKEAERCHKKGFKTFRVKTENMEMIKGEILCLSESKGINCLVCGICKGKEAPINIVINVHGMRKRRFDKFERII